MGCFGKIGLDLALPGLITIRAKFQNVFEVSSLSGKVNG